MTKNEQIKQTLKETHERRKTQTIKVFELKVNCHHTSKETFKKLNDMFKQAKWVINDVIGNEEGAFKYDYKEHRKVTNFNKWIYLHDLIRNIDMSIRIIDKQNIMYNFGILNPWRNLIETLI